MCCGIKETWARVRVGTGLEGKFSYLATHHQLQREQTSPSQKGVACFTTNQEEENFSPLSTGQPVRDYRSPPMRSLHTLNSQLPPVDPWVNTVPPNSPFYLREASFLSLLSDLPMVHRSSRTQNCNSSGYSRINSLFLVK